MEPQGGQTSFIPKSSLTPRGAPKSSSSVNLLLAIAVVILIISVVLGGGTFVYKRLLAGEINRPCEETVNRSGEAVVSCGLRATLEREERALDRHTILELQRLDSKLKAARVLLAEHRDILPVFRVLEELTLSTIQYSKFNYVANALNLEGRASNYEDIAVQAQVFAADEGRIGNFVFSDLNLDELGNVVFKLKVSVLPSILSYQGNSAS